MDKKQLEESAIKKLNNEMKVSKGAYAKLIIDYLIKRCREDQGFCEDILNSKKTFQGCFGYIKDKARKKAVNGCAAIEDATVYEWAEDYYRAADDENSKTAKKSVNIKVESSNEETTEISEPVESSTEKQESSTEEQVEKSKKEDKVTEEVTKKTVEKPKKQKTKKEKKSNDDMGQMNIFDFLG